VGVAPGEPATDLATLLGRASGEGGKVITAFAVDAWSRVYPELSFDEAIVDRAERLARLVARRCLIGPSRFVTALGTTLLPERLLTIGITADPRWAARLAENTPSDPIAAPLLVAQGGKDQIVLPEVTLDHVRGRCARGERVELRVYPEEGHISLPEQAGDDILEWTATRFGGEAVPAGCIGI
jgi:alpha-beta hydrolase superfamily lysophospholipase